MNTLKIKTVRRCRRGDESEILVCECDEHGQEDGHQTIMVQHSDEASEAEINAEIDAELKAFALKNGLSY